MYEDEFEEMLEDDDADTLAWGRKPRRSVRRSRYIRPTPVRRPTRSGVWRPSKKLQIAKYRELAKRRMSDRRRISPPSPSTPQGRKSVAEQYADWRRKHTNKKQGIANRRLEQTLRNLNQNIERSETRLQGLKRRRDKVEAQITRLRVTD